MRSLLYELDKTNLWGKYRLDAVNIQPLDSLIYLTGLVKALAGKNKKKISFSAHGGTAKKNTSKKRKIVLYFRLDCFTN